MAERAGTSAVTDRLFFALRPDAAAASRGFSLAARLCAEHGLAARPLPLELLHVTLCFLGDHPGLPAALVARALHAARGVVLPAVPVSFDRLGCLEGRGRRRAVVLEDGAGAAGVVALQRALAQALEQAGIAPEGRAFRPHMTLLYAPRPLPGRDVAPVCWTAREFVLLHSRIGRQQHLPLARFALGPQDPAGGAGLPPRSTSQA